MQSKKVQNQLLNIHFHIVSENLLMITRGRKFQFQVGTKGGKDLFYPWCHHRGQKRSFPPLVVKFSLSIWKCKSLNVEKWGWVIFPIRHSWLSSCGKNKISPLAASLLMGKFFFTTPAKPFMTQGENSFSTFVASPLKVEKSHPHFSTLRDWATSSFLP